MPQKDTLAERWSYSRIARNDFTSCRWHKPNFLVALKNVVAFIASFALRIALDLQQGPGRNERTFDLGDVNLLE